jgi:hypothetical protein
MHPNRNEHLRILLSEAASEYLLKAGECFMIAGKSSYTRQHGRVVLHLLAIPMDRATAACEVALGTRKTGKLIVAPETSPGRAHVDPDAIGGVSTNPGTTASSTNPRTN